MFDPPGELELLVAGQQPAGAAPPGGTGPSNRSCVTRVRRRRSRSQAHPACPIVLDRDAALGELVAEVSTPSSSSSSVWASRSISDSLTQPRSSPRPSSISMPGVVGVSSAMAHLLGVGWRCLHRFSPGRAAGIASEETAGRGASGTTEGRAPARSGLPHAWLRGDAWRGVMTPRLGRVPRADRARVGQRLRAVRLPHPWRPTSTTPTTTRTISTIPGAVDEHREPRRRGATSHRRSQRSGRPRRRLGGRARALAAHRRAGGAGGRGRRSAGSRARTRARRAGISAAVARGRSRPRRQPDRAHVAERPCGRARPSARAAARTRRSAPAFRWGCRRSRGQQREQNAPTRTK